MLLFTQLNFSWVLLCAVASAREDKWNDVPCNEVYEPKNCNFDELNLVTVDDYDRCAPARLSLKARNYFLGAAGRRITYKDNKDAFDRIKIIPRMLRDVSKCDMETTILGLKLDFPIGLSPVAAHESAHPNGELETVAGISSMRTIMILSSYSTTLLEEVARYSDNPTYHLWMQVYIFSNRSATIDIVQRAEKNGFKGIVLTSDSPVAATLTCNGRHFLSTDSRPVNFNIDNTYESPATTFKDIAWLKSITKLPIIAKGLLTGEDAVRAISSGASAILVSNHGGRQMDGGQATIDALPKVVDAVNKLIPSREVYMDGGIRSGHDVYKALARGAKMVFVGRPIIWGLTIGGAEGVRKVLSTLRDEFNQTMLLGGSSRPQGIRRNTLIPSIPIFS